MTVTVSTRMRLGWAIAIAAMLAGVVAVWLIEAERKVTFVNGFDEKVTVRIGTTTVTIGPKAHASARVRVGGADVEVHGEDGRLMDRHSLLVPSEDRLDAIYNPLGAAPLYQENVVYSSGGGMGGPGPNFRPLGGERFWVVDANYVLEDPPQQIDMKSKSGYTVHQRVGVQDGGWRAALAALNDAPQGFVRAAAVARRIAAALPGEADAMWWAFHGVMVLDGPIAAVATARAALERSKPTAGAEYALIRAMRRAGRVAELRAGFRKQAEQEPGSAARALQLARVLPRDEAAEVLRAAGAAHPDDKEVLTSRARLALQIGRPAEAADLYARVAAQDPDVAGDADFVLAHVRAGRIDEALRATLARVTSGKGDIADVARYVQLSRLRGAKPPRKAAEVVAQWANGSDGAVEWLAARLGDEPPAKHGEFSPIEAATLAIQQVATRDPVRALARCQEAEVGALTQLEDETALLLAAEAWRGGDRALFERLYAVTKVAVSADALRDWIDRGEEPVDGWRLDGGERAAVLLARARRLAMEGRASPVDFAEALRQDPLSGPATVAAIRWPAPPRAAPAVRMVLAEAPAP